MVSRQKAKEIAMGMAGLENSQEDFLIIKYHETTGKEISRNVDIDKVAEFIEGKFNIRTIYGLREETIEVYKEGIWDTIGKGIIKAEIESLLGVYSKNNIVSEVLEKIKRRTEIPRGEADKIPDYKRCLENGVLDLEDSEDIKFLGHSKDYNFKTKFNITYNPSAKCPKTLEFMRKTFYEETLIQFQEWLGFHLIRRYSFKKAAIFHGSKNTSKTVLLNLLTTFLGNNVSGLSLQEISRQKSFDLIALKNKDGNICDDLSSSDMKSVGGFKMAVGDGFIDGEHKFGDKDRFRNTAKNTFACNKIPSPGEDLDDEAYYERIILFPMDSVILKEKMNRNLIDELTTPEELSGLLNWAIEGYKRLVKQNGFSYEKTPEETKFLMLENGISLSKFANEVLIQEDGLKVDKETMYRVYCKWCREHKPQLSPDSKDKIGKNLIKYASYIQSSSSGNERYWLNVKLTDSYDTFSKTYRDLLSTKDSKRFNRQNKIYNNPEPVIAVSEKIQSTHKTPTVTTVTNLTEEEIKKAGYSEEETKEIQKIQEDFA